ncbi:MAG: AAA family ATPase [Ruminococcus sp.]|nr:AAA family ATPase [Ruminococcus sp.]
MSVKINGFEIENVKRVKAVAYEPSDSGLTIIGGKNGQGKTSVLDSIAWALGGGKFAPSTPYRDGSAIPPHLKVMLSNGIIVERSGKNSSLKVIDPSGNKSGQALLDTFIDQLALNLPKFMNANSKEKADALLRIIGVGDKLYQLEDEEQRLYNERRAVGQIADRKKKFADEMTEYPNVPEEPVSAAELIRQQQEILAKNGENERMRRYRAQIEREYIEASTNLQKAKDAFEEAQKRYEVSVKSAEELIDESTEELERSIRDIEALNAKIRANLDKEKAEEEAKEYHDQYDALTTKIEAVRSQRMALLDNADLPLPGLSIKDRELTYNGYKWDSMSGSEQLKVATAIVRKLNPECGFVLMDKLEQMDMDTLTEFNDWLKAEGLQVIATRVSTGGECSLIIEDGYSLDNGGADETPVTVSDVQKAWKKGEF